jgi:hypothetical protein
MRSNSGITFNDRKIGRLWAIKPVKHKNFSPFFAMFPNFSNVLNK